MVNGLKYIGNVCYKDGQVEKVNLDQFAALSDHSIHFVEFNTSRGRYGYVSGVEMVTNEKGENMIRPYVHYLKYDPNKKEWEPTDEVTKVIVSRVEDDHGNVVYSGVGDSSM